jgi:hypothetical protein
MATIEYVSQQTGSDLGAKINAADAAIGSGNAGTIVLDLSGTQSTNVTLSQYHDLIGVGENLAVTQSPGAYISLGGNNKVANFAIVSTDTSNVSGQIRASSVNFLIIQDILFSGGGTHINFTSCIDIVIRHTRHYNITATNSSAINLNTCSNIVIHDAIIPSITLPASSSDVYLIQLSSCNQAEVLSCVITGNDNSNSTSGGAALGLNESNNVNVIGGSYSTNANLDGIVVQNGSGGYTPCRQIHIVGVNASANGGSGSGSANHNGSGLDIFQATGVRVSNCIFDSNGTKNHAFANVYVWGSWEVHFSNCRISNSGLDGVDVAASQNVSFTDCQVVQSYNQGLRLAAYSGGTCTVVSGTTVNTMTFSSGGPGIGGWGTGTLIIIAGTNYRVSTVTSGTSLTLMSAASNGTNLSWSVPSIVQVNGGMYMSNGSSAGSPEAESGISVEGNGCTLYATGAACGDYYATAVQEYGIYIESGGVAQVNGCTFSGNGTRAISDSSGKNSFLLFTSAAPTTGSSSYPLTSGSVAVAINGAASSQSTVLYVSEGNSWSAITVP